MTDPPREPWPLRLISAACLLALLGIGVSVVGLLPKIRATRSLSVKILRPAEENR